MGRCLEGHRIIGRTNPVGAKDIIDLEIVTYFLDDFMNDIVWSLMII